MNVSENGLNVCTAYLSELPGDAGRLQVPIRRTVPHPDGGLSFGHLGAQLCHRVEADLLLRSVLKVLEKKKDLVMRLSALDFIVFGHFFGKQPNRKSSGDKEMKNNVLPPFQFFSLPLSPSTLISVYSENIPTRTIVQVGMFWIFFMWDYRMFFSFPLLWDQVLALASLRAVSALVPRDLISKDRVLAHSIDSNPTPPLPSAGVISTAGPLGQKMQQSLS